MSVFVNNDSIDIINLSNRSKNALHKLGINTIGDLSYVNTMDLVSVKNIGKKTLEEIEEAISFINNRENDPNYNSIYSKSMQINKKRKKFYDINGIEYIDILIKELDISVRASNCLLNNGYEYASQLLDATDDELILIKNMGLKTRQEILNIKNNLIFKKAKDINSYIVDNIMESLIDSICKQVVNIFKEKITCIHFGRLIEELKENIKPIIEKYFINENNNISTNLQVLNEICKIKLLRDAIKTQIIMLLENTRYGAVLEHIEAKLPKELVQGNIVKSIINEMINDGILEYLDNGNIQNKYLSLFEYLENLKLDRSREFFLDRLKGKTLEEIGYKENLTRERVRQIVIKIINNKPRLKEDYYADVFKQYYFSKDEFIYGFNENEYTYNYLTLTYKSKKKDLIDLIDDDKYPIYIRKVAEKIIYRNHFYVNGDRIKCNRVDIVNYVVTKYCKEEVSFQEFEELYNMFLEDYSLNEYDSLKISARTYESRLADSEIVLWKQWKRFRYYDIEAYDFDELLETLALEQYCDIEYSTKKFFEEFPVLMKQYDIHDEYELHNLLKKIYKGSENSNIKFKRMPSIEFGNADRDNQVLDLLIQYAPVTNIEFARKYEEEYGIKAETVLANYMKNFDEYFYNGVYSIDAKGLPLNELERMRLILKDNFYSINDIKRLYLREFPDCETKKINPYTLKIMGFLVYSGYVVSNKFLSSVEYFKSILLGKDIVDLRNYPKVLLNTVGFTNQLQKLKSDYSIIEFTPLKVISLKKLNNVGISIEEIRSYSKEVKNWIEDGEFFTIFSLRDKGFKHSLDKWGFDEWFYGSILSENNKEFSYRRMAQSRVFVRGNYDVTMKSLLEYIVEYKEKIDIYELVELLKNDYGLKVDKDRIIWVLKESYLYYDSIMEKVYINYDTFFEEV